MPQLDASTISETLRRHKPAQVRAWTSQGERRIPVPERHRKWAAVTETVTTLHAQRVELLDSQGQLLHVLDCGEATGGETLETPAATDASIGPVAALARAIVTGQQVALDSHVEHSKVLINAILKQQELSNKRLEVLEKLLVNQMELTHQLSSALVEQRLETAETAAAALEAKPDDKSAQLLELGTQLMGKLA